MAQRAQVRIPTSRLYTLQYEYLQCCTQRDVHRRRILAGCRRQLAQKLVVAAAPKWDEVGVVEDQ
ncbi:hypothetical protein ASPCADRAFT_208830 [Aspergillus carbonarius ITEM 5010]|uniref:Uncharacterized protein n=1 Tax=Aspergillus carbonarius (strain ITEM 5010) TaxID=602072 RepID=A0A1R3RIK0_ASPC5|nr:hypothetical protein ASPCADRAFT_208830 [Aspergillus carbonarius ITEM 5010]